VLKLLDRIIRVGDKLYVTISVLLLMALVITVSAGVISRYFFNAPFVWTEELVTVLFVYISFLGAAVASARHNHVAVDLITSKAAPKTKNLIGVIANFLIMVFLAMVIIGAVILIPQMLTHTSVALNIPRTVYYLPVLASSLLIFFVHLVEIIKGMDTLLANRNKKEDPQ
jgi:TRAP-type C4-dicarboxylate transport system permease small subunit